MYFPQIQATNKPSRPNQPTHQPKEVGLKRKGSNQTVFSPNAVDVCFALVAHPATNKPKQPKPHNPVDSPKAVNFCFSLQLQQASQPTNAPSKGRRVKKKGSRVKKERVEPEKKVQRVKKKGGGWKNCPKNWYAAAINRRLRGPLQPLQSHEQGRKSLKCAVQVSSPERLQTSQLTRTEKPVCGWSKRDAL